MGIVCNCTSRNEILGLWFALGQMEMDLLAMGASEADENVGPPWGSVVKGSCKMRLKDNRRAMEMLDCLPAAVPALIPLTMLPLITEMEAGKKSSLIRDRG